MGIIQYFISLGVEYGAYGIFLGALLESIGVPFASVSLTLASGTFIATGRVTFAEVIIAGTLGNVIGSSISYGIGYLIGNYIRKKRKGHIFKNDSYLGNFMKKYGSLSVFIGQLYGTTRAYISYPAGMLKMDFKKFILYTFLGGLTFSIVVASFSLVIRDAYYKYLFPYIGLSFGTAGLLFMLIFLATHLSIKYSDKINSTAKDILGIEDEDNQDRDSKE